MGVLYFDLLFAVWVILCGPSTPLSLAAGVLFTPVPLGVLVAWMGEQSGSIVAFLIGRSLGGDWVRRRLGKMSTGNLLKVVAATVEKQPHKITGCATCPPCPFASLPPPPRPRLMAFSSRPPSPL